ncbi:hypothetical protein Pcinc_025172 [Petrolisthes cinctipes]|uniref:Uncharacterized protein n=1 Tax=Petrolisthes cinctipes TaxID=88211 RepID=A0AAE1F910_PETCI|nr:hypothetical protein Pcinc_025172 [Petrolisthes cinctipes]
MTSSSSFLDDTPDFQELPDLIPNDGSPLPAPHLLHPISANHEEATAIVFTPKNNACINLDAFLVPSALEDTISQKIYVWGSDSLPLKLSPDPDTTLTNQTTCHQTVPTCHCCNTHLTHRFNCKRKLASSFVHL